MTTSATKKGLTRRQFLRHAATTALAGAVGAALPDLSAGPALAATGGLPAKPNILVLLSDQERNPRHWPADWADTHLDKGRKRLKQNGIDFSRAYCNASMCSPSRGCLFTGLYPAQHGVVRTLTEGGELSPSEPTLSPDLLNLAKLLGASGYDVELRGKWHLSKSAEGGSPTAEDLEDFGFHGWVPTTTGEAQDPDNFGGGCAAKDVDIVNEAIAYLRGKTPENTAQKPFCLIVSIANPHDVLAYPRLWDQEECETSYKNTADLNLGVTVPDSYAADDLSTKPAVQLASMDLYAWGLGTLNTALERTRYVNFYAYLHTIVDQQMDDILTVLAEQGLTDSTVVARTSDHGEMGLAHGGLRQKMFNVYEESINVPLIISNPLLFPTARTTEAYAGLVDLTPTIASLCGVPRWKWGHLPGKDLTPILTGAATSVQDTVLFTFDDEYAGQGVTNPWIKEPCHIRCVIHRDADGEWKYARYYDPEGVAAEEYEMYRLRDEAGADWDPEELDNLANPASPNYAAFADKRAELAALLAETEARRLAPVKQAGPPLGSVIQLLLGAS